MVFGHAGNPRSREIVKWDSGRVVSKWGTRIRRSFMNAGKIEENMDITFLLWEKLGAKWYCEMNAD